MFLRIRLPSVASNTKRANKKKRDFYVYVHRDENGNVFYVGKGKGTRAWATDRHELWHRYVDTRLGGNYTVDIVERDLTEDEAEQRENDLMLEYGSQLVNVANWGRDTDFDACAKYHKLRDENRAFVAETRPLEARDPELAVERYRTALARQREYESLVLERGLLAELMEKRPEVVILDRLTICLVRLGRVEEAREEAERFFAAFPAVRSTVGAMRIVKRVTTGVTRPHRNAP